MLVMLQISAGSALAQQNLFFSEYIEGGGNNKAFEIFNDDLNRSFNYIKIVIIMGILLMILIDSQWVQLSIWNLCYWPFKLLSICKYCKYADQ